MKLDRIDKKLAKLGLYKTIDNDFGIEYERYNENHRFTQKVTLLYKYKWEDFLLQSYDKDLYDDENIGNTCVGLKYEEVQLLAKKMKKSRKEYQKNKKFLEKTRKKQA